MLKATISDNRKKILAHRLSPTDFDLVLKMLASVNYVSSNVFYEKGAEKRFFGKNARQIKITEWESQGLADGDNYGIADEDEYQKKMEKSRQKKDHLSAKDERELFLRYNFAKYRMCKILDSIGHSNGRIFLARIKEALFWYKRVMDIENQLAQANMPLAIYMAERFGSRVIDFFDLVSEGSLTLLRSINKFDVGMGYKFSTYFCKGAMRQFSRVAERKIKEIKHFKQVLTIDPVDENSREDRPTQQQINNLYYVLQNLPAWQRRLIAEYYGLEPGKKLKLEEIGKHMRGICRERVRQYKQSILTEMRFLMTVASFK